MKTKKITKKLELNKETLTNLEDSKLKDLKGGWWDNPTDNQSCKLPIC